MTLTRWRRPADQPSPKDFDAKGPDDQARDRDSGARLWQVRVLDLDPEAGKFGASEEVKVKIAAEYQPVPPETLSDGEAGDGDHAGG